MKQFEKCMFMKFGEDMQSLADPLKRYFNINFFSYIKTYLDNSHFALSTSPEWLNCLYNEYHHNGTAHKNMDSYKDSYDLWSQYADQTTYDVMYNQFNIAHGFTIIKKHNEYCELYGFGTTSNNSHMKNWYLHNIDLLEKFCLIFKEKSVKLLQAAESDRLILPRNLTTSPAELYVNHIVVDEITRQNFLNEIGYNETPRFFGLSKYETACLFHLVKGKTAKEIAIILNKSKRTIESRIESIKDKLNCKTKSEITSKAIEQGLVQFIPNKYLLHDLK